MNSKRTTLIEQNNNLLEKITILEALNKESRLGASSSMKLSNAPADHKVELLE